MIKSLYIHIPFCRKICPYCAFVRQLYCRRKVDKYLILIEKIIKSKYKNNKFKTIYIGGRTPNCLTIKQLTKLLGCLMNKLLSKLSFFCINCKEEIMYDNLISHYEESDKCKIFKTKESESKINNDGLIPKPVIRKEENPKNIETQINIINKEKRLNYF